MESSGLLDVVALQSHFRAQRLKNLKRDPNWNAALLERKPNATSDLIRDLNKSSVIPESPNMMGEEMDDGSDDDEPVTSVMGNAATESTRERAIPLMHCCGRGFRRISIAKLPDFENFEDFEKNYLMQELSTKSRGCGRGRGSRQRGAGSISTQMRRNQDTHFRKIREESLSVFADKRMQSQPEQKPLRTPKTKSLAGNGFTTGASLTDLSSSSSIMPNMTSSSSRASSTRSSLASSRDGEFLPIDAPNPGSNNEILEMSTPVATNFDSLSHHSKSHYSSFNSVKSSVLSEPNEAFCTPEEAQTEEIDELYSQSLDAVNRLESNLQKTGNLFSSRSEMSVSSSAQDVSSKTVINSDNIVNRQESNLQSTGNLFSSRSKMSVSSPAQDKSGKTVINNDNVVNRLESNSQNPGNLFSSRSKMSVSSPAHDRSSKAVVNNGQTFVPNISPAVNSSSSSSQEENYERSNIYRIDSKPEWDPFEAKRKDPEYWKRDDFPQLQTSVCVDKPVKTSRENGASFEKLSLKSIGLSFQNKPILEPVADSEDTDPSSSSNSSTAKLTDILKLMSETDETAGKPETILITKIPPHITEDEIRDLILSYATISSMDITLDNEFLRAEISVTNCDGDYLVELLNENSPFGGDQKILCKIKD